MKRCNKCSKAYSDNARFCAQCGVSLTDGVQVPASKMHCKNCNGTMTIEDDSTMLVCPFCGSKELIAESDAVTVERIKQKTHKDIETGKQQLEQTRMQHEFLMSEEQKKAEEVHKFKKGCLSKLLIMFSVLCFLMYPVFLSDKKIFASLVLLAILGLFVCSYLMGIQAIKEKFKGMRIVVAVIGFVLYYTLFALVSYPSMIDEVKPEDLKWSVLEMHESIPQPSSTYGKISSDYSDRLSVDLYDVSYGDYKSYRQECRDMGYDVNASSEGDLYYAFNEQGLELSLIYHKAEEQLTITLQKPQKMYTIEWPDSGVGSLLPIPKSATGTINYEDEITFECYVGETSIDEYSDYVKLCMDSGFTKDLTRVRTCYTARNDDDVEIIVSYRKDSLMSVRVKAYVGYEANKVDEKQPSQVVQETQKPTETS